MDKLVNTTLQTLLNELVHFQNQGEKLNPEEFALWKKRTSSTLTGNYKIRFDRLAFYTYEDTNQQINDLPF